MLCGKFTLYSNITCVVDRMISHLMQQLQKLITSYKRLIELFYLACGRVIGTGNPGSCFPYTGRRRTCYLASDGRRYQFFSFRYGGRVSFVLVVIPKIIT